MEFGDRGSGAGDGALEGFVDDIFGCDGDAEEFAGDIGDGAGGAIALGGHGGAGSDTENVTARSLAQFADEEGDVCALATAIGVEFVEDEEFEVGGLDQGFLMHSGEHEFEHDVVGQQDLGRVVLDVGFLGEGFLARVFFDADGCVGDLAEEFVEFFFLGVDEGVHRVDEDGPDALDLGIFEDVVEDGGDVGHAFAGACACGNDVGLLALGGEEGLFLVVVVAVGLAVAGEVLGAVGMEDAAIDQLSDGGSGFVGRVEMEQGVGPEFALVELFRDEGFDAGVADAEEAFDVGAVVLDDFIAELEDVEAIGGVGFGGRQGGCCEGDAELVEKLGVERLGDGEEGGVEVVLGPGGGDVAE